MENYSNEEYSKAYTELLEILKTISRTDLIKIPRETLQFYFSKRDVNHKFIYDENLQFKDPKMMQLTKILFANLYVEYWATAERKKRIKELDREELVRLETEKQELYSVDNLFKKKENVANKIEETSIICIEKKNVFFRIIEKFKNWLKLT